MVTVTDLPTWRMSNDDSRTPTEQVLIDRELLRQVIEHVQEARSGSIDPGLRQTYGLRRKRLLDQLHTILEEAP